MKVLVLVVSEDPRAAEWVRMALGPGCEIESAPSGREAVRRAGDDDFDLVIADAISGSFGGFGLARELKFLPDPPAVIVLIEREQDAWLARWSGADRWLLRPVDPLDLSRAAAELLAEPEEGAATGTTSAPERGPDLLEQPLRS